MSSEVERRSLVLRSALDLCLLTVVSRGALYGYELTSRLAQRGLVVAEGSAYPLLARLERAGLLTSEMRTGAGRTRRYYAITTAGRHALATGRQEWLETSQAVGSVLADQDPPADQPPSKHPFPHPTTVEADHEH